MPSTMLHLEPLGDALLLLILEEWISSTFQFIRNEDRFLLLNYLLNDGGLSGVVKQRWCLGDMILTDSAVDLFTSRNVVKKVMNSGLQLPDSFVASCLKSFIGAVYLEYGYTTTKHFTSEFVLPHLI